MTRLRGQIKAPCRFRCTSRGTRNPLKPAQPDCRRPRLGRSGDSDHGDVPQSDKGRRRRFRSGSGRNLAGPRLRMVFQRGEKTYDYNVGAHEFGHLLGLPDEYENPVAGARRIRTTMQKRRSKRISSSSAAMPMLSADFPLAYAKHDVGWHDHHAVAYGDSLGGAREYDERLHRSVGLDDTGRRLNAQARSRATSQAAGRRRRSVTYCSGTWLATALERSACAQYRPVRRSDVGVRHIRERLPNCRHMPLHDGHAIRTSCLAYARGKSADEHWHRRRA